MLAGGRRRGHLDDVQGFCMKRHDCTAAWPTCVALDLVQWTLHCVPIGQKSHHLKNETHRTQTDAQPTLTIAR